MPPVFMGPPQTEPSPGSRCALAFSTVSEKKSPTTTAIVDSAITA
jgi:hypothetical protein